MAGIYLHIPFCKQACVYCNFHFSTSLRLKDELLSALHQEIQLQSGFLNQQPVETIYFGGGTPSLLSADEINQLIDTIGEYHDIGQLQECTLEANPDDLSTTYLKQLKNTPIDRLSIGVQSFYDRDLDYMHRAHNASEADYCIKAAQDHELTNLTIDLIYGTPGLTNTDWKKNLAKVQELSIPHFSAYALTVEEGTALHHNINKKAAKPVNTAQAADQLTILMDTATEMGFEHYEISNLSLPNHHAIHNTNYWHGKHYLGIGPSAHSFDGGSRRWNIANNALYIKSLLKENKLNYEKETLTQTQQLNEYIMTALRTKWGIDLQKVSTQWGNDYTSEIMKQSNRYIQDNKLINLNNNKLILTNKGKLIADHIASQLFFL